MQEKKYYLILCIVNEAIQICAAFTLIVFPLKVGRRKNKEEEEPGKGIKDAQRQKFWR